MKRTLTSIAAAALVLGAMTPAAFAASTANSAAKVVGTKAVVVDGTTVSNPYELTAVDSGNTTAYFGIYYFNQALSKVGFTASWDGTNHVWNITAPGVDASSIKFDSTGNVGSGNTTIKVNGVVVKYINTFSHVDPAGSSDTTYFPVYYVNNLLTALGVGGNWDATAGLTVNSPKLAKASVTALNADQIQVVFNSPVDQTTAEDISNYSLNGTALASASPAAATDATASLQADGRTVIITAGTSGGFAVGSGSYLNPALASGSGYVLTIDGVKSKDKATTLSSYDAPAFAFAGDTTAPSITKISSTASTSTTTVDVTYSEPVQAVGLYYINGTAAANVVQTSPNTVELTSATSLVPGTNYSLQVVNEKDSSGNLLSNTQSFAVVSDVAAPSITNVQAVGDNVIRVTFSKKMNASTVSKTYLAAINNASGTTVTSDLGTVVPTTGDTTGTEFDIPFTASSSLFDATTGQLSLTLDFLTGMTDASGNALAPTTKVVTLSLNKTVPAVTKVEYVQPGGSYDSISNTHGAVVLHFNEDLAAPGASLTEGTDVTAINDSGVIENSATLTGWTITQDANDASVLVLEPAVNLTGAKSETLQFAAGLFGDTSNAGNTNKAFTSTVDLTQNASSADTTKPVVTALSVAGAHSLVSGQQVDTITYGLTDAGNNIDWSTVTNTNNYRINNAALPSGSYVTQSAGTVTIHLPAGAISTTGNYSVTISGIKDLAGNAASTYVQNNVTLEDNTAPTIKSATFNSDGTLSVAFSEAVTGSNYADYSITVNGVTKTGVSGSTPTAGQFTVADGTGADAGKVVVKFGDTLATGARVVVTVNTGALTADSAGNVATAYGSIAVSK